MACFREIFYKACINGDALGGKDEKTCSKGPSGESSPIPRGGETDSRGDLMPAFQNHALEG